MKKLAIILGIILIVLVLGFFALNSYIRHQELNGGIATTTPQVQTAEIKSFEDCMRAGYPVMESNPRQCHVPDGRTYAEEIPQKATYVNASADMIKVENPFPGAVTGKSFTVTGTARGTWYFEASFPVELLDKNGKVLVTAPAQAQGDWMTENFVPFKVTLTAPSSYMGPARLVLKKDNPSGMPEHDASVSFPITIEY